MKKIVSVVFVFIFTICIFLPTVKANSTYTIELEVTKNKEEKEFELYILLPQEYVMYAINKAGLDIEYIGTDTLKQNDISTIEVNKNDVQDETYSEDGTEYIQILLEPDGDGIYAFDILEDYPRRDMKFRAKNDEKDYIMHIDNFKVENDICKIEYNYDDNEIKQPNKTIINFGTLLLIVILVLIIIIAIISKLETKE